MPEALSKSQIDKLGERLMLGSPADEDLILLDRFRQSYADAYEVVFKRMGETLSQNDPGAELIGREAKSTGAIVAKLKRGTFGLSQIQDIAGCRIIVADIISQDRLVALLAKEAESPESIFGRMKVVDRRVNPSYGYRAVHLVVKIIGRPVEIQIRSKLQHLWALTSEKMADTIDHDIKYGGGSKRVQADLQRLTERVTVLEDKQKELHNAREGLIGAEFLHQVRKVGGHEIVEKVNKLASDTSRQVDLANQNTIAAFEGFLKDLGKENEDA